MTRKALEAFDPAKLRPGESREFEVRNPKTKHQEVYFFYRDKDGELFTTVEHRHDTCREALKVWKKMKRAKPEKFKQMDFTQNG